MKNPDRLYDLIPVVYRQRDAEQGYPLQALLRVIAEQVEVVEDDITQLYENWFIETCQEWVVPYIGDLIGYQLLNDVGESSDVSSPRGVQREQIVIPRRDVANTIGDRRRKGTLAILEELAMDVADWPARSVEFYKLLGWTQNLHTPHPDTPRYYVVRVGDTAASVAARFRITVQHLLWLNPRLNSAQTPDAPLCFGARLLVGWRRGRGETADLRNGDAMDLIDSPFDETSHTVDVRRIDSHRTLGRYNIPSVGLFMWRLKCYSITGAPACCLEEEGPNCYTFNVLGIDTPLYNLPQTTAQPVEIAGELNLPTAIRRRRFAKHPGDFYGQNLSLAIWAPDWPKAGAPQPVPISAIIPANLENWICTGVKDSILVDPISGRMVFLASQIPRQGVTVNYHYGFSADMGGGEYDRPISQPATARVYTVGSSGDYETIGDALRQWNQDKQPPAGSPPPANPSAAIEITDSGVYTERIALQLGPGEYLQIRAANGMRPVLRLLDYVANQPDAFSIGGAKGSRFVLDGLLVTGRGLLVRGQDNSVERVVPNNAGDLCDVTIRHCTLVPGWGMECNCEPRRPSEPSIELLNTTARIVIEHTILGAILVVANEAATDPVRICMTDSIFDATSNTLTVLGAADNAIAYACLSIARCTVFGQVRTQEIALAENCLFNAQVCAARRQKGCVRFCYVAPGSRTPRRFECQPDLVMQAVTDAYNAAQGKISAAELDASLASEQARVQPVFNSIRYGTPTYCQLGDGCASEITTGADDESEMGAFHDLYQPQRAANLGIRLQDFTPAGMDAGIINAT